MSDMTFTLYIELLNNILASEAHTMTSYATADHYYNAGYTPVEAAATIVSARTYRRWMRDTAAQKSTP